MTRKETIKKNRVKMFKENRKKLKELKKRKRLLKEVIKQELFKARISAAIKLPTPIKCETCGHTVWCIHNWEDMLKHKKDLTKL